MITHYKYTDKELKELLKTITIIVDTREQNANHITKWFDKKHVPYITKKLDAADYSFCLPKNEELGIMRDLYFWHEICIERKGSLDELAGNFTNDRVRIEEEFIRHKGKLTLLIENADYIDVVNGNYRSEYKAKSFTATLHSFENRYNVPFFFLKDSSLSGMYIYYQFYYYLRNILK